MKEQIKKIQTALKEQNIDAWLFPNFHYYNRFMNSILKLDENMVQSRRCFYLIPAEGEPVKLLHAIEPEQLGHLPGEAYSYSGWKTMEPTLKEMVAPYKTVAMEYSSATLIQTFEAVWNDLEYESHVRAANVLYDCVTATFKEVARRVKEDGKTDEYSIQQFMDAFFEEHGMIAGHAPIVAVNENSANPHYEPGPDRSAPIKEGDFLLIDLWCKEKDTPRSMYADITWTGFVGEEVPEENTKIFNIVAAARDAASEAIASAYKEGRDITGAQADDICRKVIVDAGYGEYFIHRTGHSIGEEVHGNGGNVDNLETRDERKLIPRTCFSIEPGIYLPGKFGVRSEIDVYIHPDGRLEETGQPKQTEIVAMYTL
jgi:Xaa-Pro dipeptidase